MARPAKRKQPINTQAEATGSVAAPSSSVLDSWKRVRKAPPTPPRTGSLRGSCSASSSGDAAAAEAATAPLDAIAAACVPPAQVRRLRGDQLEPPLLRTLVDLVTRNMRDYVRRDESKEKRAELAHPDTHIICVKSGRQLLGFASYRLNAYEEGVPVGYLYELQLEPEARGMRLGTTLVGEVEADAKAAGCKGLMLTVHTRNAAARRFYRGDALGFSTSPISPEACAPPSIAASCDYEILQRIWDDGAEQTLAMRGAEARKANYVAAFDSGKVTVRLVMKGGRRGKGGTESPEPEDTQKEPATEPRRTQQRARGGHA